MENHNPSASDGVNCFAKYISGYMVSKNIMNLISLGIHIFPILIKFLLCFGRALLISEVGEGGLLRSLELGWPQIAAFISAFHPPRRALCGRVHYSCFAEFERSLRVLSRVTARSQDLYRILATSFNFPPLPGT